MTTDYMKMTVQELLARYVEFKTPAWKSGPRGEENLRSYKGHFGRLLPFWGHRTVGQLCEGDQLRTLCQEYAVARGTKASTVRKELQGVLSALTWAWKQRWITGQPLGWLPPADGPRDRNFTTAEIEALLDAASSYPTEHHIKLFIYLAVFTPALKTAILSLTWDRVDFAKGVISLEGRVGQPRLKVSMNDRLREVLTHAASVKEAGCKHVISWRGKPVDSPSHAVRRVFERAGLEDATIDDLRKWSPNVMFADDSEADSEAGGPRLVISYSTRDGMLPAATLCDALEAKGARCWIAPRDVGGGVYSGQIIEAIESGRGLIVVLTPKANESKHVLQEVNAAHDIGSLILPVIVNNTAPSPDLRYYLQTSQSTQWSDGATTSAALLRLVEQYEARQANKR